MSTKSPSFCMTTISAGPLLAGLLLQSRDCSCSLSRHIVAPPPLWLHQHTALRAHDFAPCPDLWHQSRLANVTVPEAGDGVELLLLLPRALSSRIVVLTIRLDQGPRLGMTSVIPPRPYVPSWNAHTKVPFPVVSRSSATIMVRVKCDWWAVRAHGVCGRNEKCGHDWANSWREQNSSLSLKRRFEGGGGGGGGVYGGMAVQIITSTAGVCYT